MDKQTTIGFILIALVLIVWMWIQSPAPPQHVQGTTDTIAHMERRDSAAMEHAAVVPPPAPSPSPADAAGKYFAARQTGEEHVLTVKTGLYLAEITNRGGMVRKWELTQYLAWDKRPVQLVDFNSGGDLSMLFTSSDGKLVNTSVLYFDASYHPWTTVELTGDQTFTVDFTLPVEGGGKLIKRYTFKADAYSFDVQFVFQNMEQVISNFEYQVIWEHGLRYQEHNSVDESSYAMGYAYSGGELAEIDATSATEPAKRDLNGSTTWVATRNKYFLLALLPDAGVSQGAYLEGKRMTHPDKGVTETYSVALKMPFKGGHEESAHLRVYLGPLEYNIVRSYGEGLENTMNLGAAWIIRPIAEYVMIPLFTFLRKLIPNYGLVIIVFSIIIKIALHPLTRQSMRSMKKMQALSPLLSEIKEKYKDSPEKINQATMNLYKEYGINPAAGCLPLLLQMPILFALWAVLRSNIELRQANFVGWIHDLSIPDNILKLPFTIPIFGITELSGVALAMGVTMFVQQKMSTTDPRQKAMIWMMPIMMTLIFNNLPSGLNLYYFVFNILSIGQQMWINKQHGDEPLRKVEPKKKGGGILGKITKDLPKLR